MTQQFDEQPHANDASTGENAMPSERRADHAAAGHHAAADQSGGLGNQTMPGEMRAQLEAGRFGRSVITDGTPLGNGLQNYSDPAQGPSDFPLPSNPGNVIIPTVREITPRGERVYDIYSRLLDERIVCIDEPITAPLASAVMAQIQWLAAQDSKKDIQIQLNSPGGSVTDGLAIYDVMQAVEPDVSVVVRGQAASMGAVLLSGGTKGKRFVLPNARVMIHSIRGGTYGIANDLIAQGKEMERLNTKLKEILAANSGQTFEQVDKDFVSDLFMDAEESVRYGLADHIVSAGSEHKVMPRHTTNEAKSSGDGGAGPKDGDPVH